MRRKQACRVPSGMLRLEKTPKLLVGKLDVEVTEELPHEPGVLDLLDCPRRPEELLVALAKVRDELLELWKPAAADRLEPRPVARLDERFVVGKPHQRVAPIEENRLQHGG